MKVQTSTFFFCIILHVALGQKTPVSKCDSSNGIVPESVVLRTDQAICTSQPCLCNPGFPFYMDFNFTAPSYLENIKPSVLATAVGVNITYPLSQRDACEGVYNTMCPLAAKEKVNYRTQMDLLPFLPEIALTIRFSIVDQDTNTDAICFTCDLQVKKLQG